MLPKYKAVPGNRHVERNNISVRADPLPDAHHKPDIISGPWNEQRPIWIDCSNKVTTYSIEQFIAFCLGRSGERTPLSFNATLFNESYGRERRARSAHILFCPWLEMLNEAPGPQRVFPSRIWFFLFLLSAGDRFVQLCRQLDDCAQHQAEPLHRARPPVRHQVHLHCQGHQPGGEPQQRAGETQDQQYGWRIFFKKEIAILLPVNIRAHLESLDVLFLRSTFQAGSKVSAPEAAAVPWQPNGGARRDVVQEEPQSGALLQPQQLRRHGKRLHRQRPPLLGGSDWRKHMVNDASAFSAVRGEWRVGCLWIIVSSE